MKKIVLSILIAILLTAVAFIFSGCEILFADTKPDPKECKHDFSDWYVEVEASCIADGVEKRECYICGYYEEKTVKGDHKITTIPGEEPSCIDGGFSECSYCSVCGKKIVPSKYIDPIGHTPVIDEGVSPTCTTNGWTEGVHCSVCGEVLVEKKEIPAEHTIVKDERVEPTCTAPGVTEGSHCSVCGDILSEQESVPALGHTVSDPVVENYVAPDCENDGSYDSVIYCSICDEELSRETITVDALGHTEVVDPAVEPTCITPGVTEGLHCSVCGDILSEQESVPALGHTEVVDPAVEPTCAVTGLTEGSHCSTCGKVFIKQEIISTLNHTEVIDKSVKPTCTKPGYTQGSHCLVCNGVIIAQTVIPATGHSQVNMADAVIEDYVAPDCENNGSYSSVVYCKICGVEIFRTSSSIEALGHTVVTDLKVEANCTESGLTEGSHCSICNEVLVEQIVIAATGHDEVIQAAVAPTCTSTGLTEGKYCNLCNEIFVKQEKVDKLEHDYVEGNCKYCKITSNEYFIFSLLSNDTYSIKAKDVSMPSNVVIPSEYNGKAVEAIAHSAFRDCSSIVNLTIPNSVKSIGDLAFESCSGLINVDIPDSVIYLGTRAFGYCDNLLNVVIGDNVAEIGDDAFKSCYSLKTVVIGDSVSSIGYDVFRNCINLISIEVSKNNQYYKSINGNLYDLAVTWLIQYAIGKKDEMFEIPDSVTYIGSYAFHRCENIRNVVLGNNVMEIGNSAFESCTNLTKIVIPKTVTDISNYAFRNCHGLSDIYYTGSESEWRDINIFAYNDGITGTTIHYNYVPEE